MLRISKMTDYAMLVMSHLAKSPAQILSASAIARELYLKSPTVSKILKMLAEAGLVQSMRGAEGGYRLARPAENISLVDILTAMEGDVSMTECCEVRGGRCVIDGLCAMRENWRKINGVMRDMLSRLSIADMQQSLPQGLFMSAAANREKARHE